MLFFLLKKNLTIYATMCPILINGTVLSYTRYGQWLMAQTQNHPLAQLATDVLAALLTRSQSYRTHLAYNESTLVQQPCL